MECTPVFSGRSAGKGKDGVGGGLSTLSRMAVVGHSDGLVSASGCSQCMSWSSSNALNFPLHIGAFRMGMTSLLTMGLQPSDQQL